MSGYIADNSRAIKGVIIGVVVSIVILMILMCGFAAILNFISAIPYGIIDYIMIAAQGIAVLIGAYIASAVAKSRGLLLGLICGAIVFLLQLAIGMSIGDGNVGILTAIRAAVLLLTGMLGGIKGVNRKEKLHIK